MPSPHTLHLLNYEGQPFVLSKEVSSWLWEADLLSYHLRKAGRSFAVKVLSREDAPQLFESLIKSQSTFLWEVLAMESLTLYSLQE